MVFPVVVDTASFAEQLVFTMTSGDGADIQTTYYPAVGTSQATPLQCGSVRVDGSSKAYTSLRQLCPGLAEGSQYGYLYAATLGTTPFSGFSRVSNAQGIGFSVEAFPVNTFTGGRSIVSGIRRLSATPTSPAYQTNCFIGVINEVSPEASPVQTTISFTLLNHFGSMIGTGEVTLVPGQLTRILDVFGAANVPPGNYDGVTAVFEESGDGEPSVMTFCTVQDNTSFGADFRIGKQDLGASNGSLVPNPVAQDDGALRRSVVGTNVALSTGPGTASARAFEIAAGGGSNAHVMYFRHPDRVLCSVKDPSTGQIARQEYGLEIRLLASDGVTVLAGGNDVQSFSLYLGDKRDRDTGVNTRYVLEVESSETNTAANRPYQLECSSGSGHGLGELVRTNGPDQF